MKKQVAILAASTLLMGACGAKETTESSMKDMAADVSHQKNNAALNSAVPLKAVAEKREETRAAEAEKAGARMVMYQAHLEIRVKEYDQAKQELEKEVQKAGGYVVASQSYAAEEGKKSGHLQLRVPQPAFQTYLAFVQEKSQQVDRVEVTGQDVTEEYVDTEARLKAKRVLEARLITFLSEAKKTEDLLRISEDLAAVQSDMEAMTGRMNWLKTQTDLASVTIDIQEEKVVVPSVSGETWQTGQEIKREFAASVNVLIAMGSKAAVLIIGKSPLIAILATLVAGGLLIRRKKKRSK